MTVVSLIASVCSFLVIFQFLKWLQVEKFGSFKQMSGCLSLAYRAVTQKPLQFFIDNRQKLFTVHDTKFGVDPEPKFSYTGDEHYRQGTLTEGEGPVHLNSYAALLVMHAT
jgi:hypothetical protein